MNDSSDQYPVIVVEHTSDSQESISLIGYAETAEEAVMLAEAMGYRVMLYQFDAEQLNWTIECCPDE